MSLEKAIRAVLIADGTTNLLVGARIYPHRRPKGSTLPAIVYQNVYSKMNESIADQSGNRRTRLSIDLLASSYSDVKALRTVVESALVNYTGTIESETIHSLRLESAVDIDETDTPGSQFSAFRTILDFIIWHN